MKKIQPKTSPKRKYKKRTNGNLKNKDKNEQTRKNIKFSTVCFKTTEENNVAKLCGVVEEFPSFRATFDESLKLQTPHRSPSTNASSQARQKDMSLLIVFPDMLAVLIYSFIWNVLS